MDTYIESLLRERDGYVMRGLADRVAAIDAELSKAGYVPAAPKERAVSRPAPEAAVADAPRRRKP